MNKPSWFTPTRHPLYLLLLAALAALALWGFWPRAHPVETAPVVRSPLTVSLTEEGRTRLRDRYTVSAPMDGILERITLEPGDRVEAGAPVAALRPARAALLDPATRAETEARWRAYRDDVAAANALVAAARAEQRRSQAALSRAEALSAGQLIARNELDALRAEAAAASSALQAAQARARSAAIQRDGARAVLDLQGTAGTRRILLRAPAAGRVVRRLVESEGPVRSGQALLEIGDPQELEVVVEALTADAVSMAPGTPVRLLRWGGEPPLRGRVHLIEPGAFTKVSALGVEEQRVLVVITMIDPPEKRPGLADGFRVEAEFILWRADDVLTVPTAALFRDGPHWAVYTVDAGRARLQRVQIGHIGKGSAEIIEGLEAGTEVVLYPGDSVRDGIRVVAGAAA